MKAPEERWRAVNDASWNGDARDTFIRELREAVRETRKECATIAHEEHFRNFCDIATAEQQPLGNSTAGRAEHRIRALIDSPEKAEPVGYNFVTCGQCGCSFPSGSGHACKQPLTEAQLIALIDQRIEIDKIAAGGELTEARVIDLANVQILAHERVHNPLVRRAQVGDMIRSALSAIRITPGEKL